MTDVSPIPEVRLNFPLEPRVGVFTNEKTGRTIRFQSSVR